MSYYVLPSGFYLSDVDGTGPYVRTGASTYALMGTTGGAVIGQPDVDFFLMPSGLWRSIGTLLGPYVRTGLNSFKLVANG